MPKYLVHTTRIEAIDFEVEAPSALEAEDRVLQDGDEVGSRTISFTVDYVSPAPSAATRAYGATGCT